MSDTLDVYYSNFLNHLKEFYKRYDSFSKDNAKTINQLRFTVFTQKPVDLFSSLIDSIHNAVLLYDNHLEHNGKLSQEDKSFMSAIKCVENILKHTKNPPKITDLITSTPQLLSTVLLVTRVPQWVTGAKLISTWNDISALQGVYEGQRTNYNKHLKGKELLVTLQALEKIIKHYECDISSSSSS